MSWMVLLGSLVVFLGTAAASLKQHEHWAEFTTPGGVAELLILAASFCSIVVSALKAQLPRDPGKVHSSRSSDPKDLGEAQEDKE